ncbi:hypothetical protein QBC47DRAFT_377014, partial [Echria macrotheca]
EEVTFQDWEILSTEPDRIMAKSGFRKIEYCCFQAASEGIEWVWIDTCCIDKKSSAELSEAINSMFRWYRNAKICYAYLADVSAEVIPEHDEPSASIAKSRWFTRGWTLQELIAPSELEFFSDDWKKLGSRQQLCDLVTAASGIEQKFLCGEPLQTASIAKRMSWAANRQTSRIEDMAYCLLGIFDVNMPLLYGEGKRAFRRLQQEILKENPYDQSLFAWGKVMYGDPRELIDSTERYHNLDVYEWDEEEAKDVLRGLFADSPRQFASSANICPIRSAPYFFDPIHKSTTPFTVGDAVRIELGALSKTTESKFSARHLSADLQVVQPRSLIFPILLCNCEGSGGATIVLPLVCWGMDFFGRIGEVYILPNALSLSSVITSRKLLHIAAEKPHRIQRGDVLVRMSGPSWDLFQGQCAMQDFLTGFGSAGFGVVTIADAVGKLFISTFFLGFYGGEIGFSIHFAREEKDSADQLGRNIVSFSPILIRASDAEHICSPGRPCPLTPPTGQIYHCTKHCPWPSPDDSSVSKVMRVPDDTWEHHAEGFPPIKVRIRRKHVGSDEDAVFDLVDIMVRDADVDRYMPYHVWSASKTPLQNGMNGQGGPYMQPGPYGQPYGQPYPLPYRPGPPS